MKRRPAAADNEKERPGTLREFKESAERAFLVDKLRENGWNISKTAEVIGTPRSNLYKKLEQYGISQEATAEEFRGSWRRSPPQADDARSTAAAGQTIAFAESEGRGGGKSELRRAVRRVTPGQGNLKESGTENIPPIRSRGRQAGRSRR